MLAAVSSAEGTQIMHDCLLVLASVLYASGASTEASMRLYHRPSPLSSSPPPPQVTLGPQEQRSMVQDVGCKLAAVRPSAVLLSVRPAKRGQTATCILALALWPGR